MSRLRADIAASRELVRAVLHLSAALPGQALGQAEANEAILELVSDVLEEPDRWQRILGCTTTDR